MATREELVERIAALEKEHDKLEAKKMNLTQKLHQQKNGLAETKQKTGRIGGGKMGGGVGKKAPLEEKLSSTLRTKMELIQRAVDVQKANLAEAQAKISDYKNKPQLAKKKMLTEAQTALKVVNAEASAIGWHLEDLRRENLAPGPSKGRQVPARNLDLPSDIRGLGLSDEDESD